jgi:hypothetical protein
MLLVLKNQSTFNQFPLQIPRRTTLCFPQPYLLVRPTKQNEMKSVEYCQLRHQPHKQISSFKELSQKEPPRAQKFPPICSNGNSAKTSFVIL